MSTNSGIVFEAPRLPSISLINRGEAKSEIDFVLSNRPCPSYPPLRLSQILKLIKNGSADAITLIEWLGVFNDDFNSMDDEQQSEACILLWKAIAENPRVASLALHMAANSISDKDKKFPKCLIDSMSIAIKFLVGKNQLRVKWLIGLSQKDYSHCLELSIVAGYSPFRFSTTLNLPELGKFRKGVVSAFVPYIKSNFDDQNLSTFELCIEDMTESEKIVTYDALLTANDKILSHFDTSIQKKCLPDSNDTLWYELSHFSRDLLRQRFNLGGYFALKGLVDKICQKDCLSILGLDEKSARQLKSRADFWSNYSDSFNQVRLLVPARTADCIGIDESKSPSDVIVLPNLDQESEEVFIFELGTKIVIEVLRGPASEIRFFDLTSRNQSRLLKDKQLTLKKIRTMACELIFDHVKLWQYFCENKLRTEFGIFPNKNTSIFNGLGNKFGQYNPDGGLPMPKNSEVSERADQLDAWSKTFWIREALVKKLQPNALLINGWKEMQLAELEKLQGNSIEFNNLIDKAVNYENPAAMCLKAVSVFSSKSPTFNQWKEAEGLVSKAIKKGYEPAKSLVNKYNLKIENKATRLKRDQLSRLNKIVKNKESIPTSIAEKILKESDRPYRQLLIDELEVLSDNITGRSMKEGLIWELSFRLTKKRNTALLNRLKEM